MILAPDRLVGNTFLGEQFAKFGMKARVIAPPKGAKRIFRIFGMRTRFACGAQTMRCWGRFMHQFHVAVGASRKPLPVLRFALWTIHSAPSLLHLGLPTHRRGVEISPLLPRLRFRPKFTFNFILTSTKSIW